MNEGEFMMDNYKGYPVVACPGLYQSENVVEVNPSKEEEGITDIEMIDADSPEYEMRFRFLQHTEMMALYSLDLLISQLNDDTRYTADGVDRKDSLVKAMNTIHEMVYGVGID